MPGEITFDMNPKDTKALFGQMDNAQKTLGRSAFSSMQWGARLLCESLGAQTKQARSKLRKIVKNPHPQAGTDKRRAIYGVTGYKDGRERFIPIYRTGEFGKYRFYDRKTMAWYDRSTGKWMRIASGPDPANPEAIVPGIKDSPRRKIPYRGLAKKSWRGAKSLVGRGGTKGAMGVRSLATVTLRRSSADPQIKMTNKLRYAMAAFKSGPSTLSFAMSAAASKMRNRINAEAAKRMGAK
jgi:hypothetical protein